MTQTIFILHYLAGVDRPRCGRGCARQCKGGNLHRRSGMSITLAMFWNRYDRAGTFGVQSPTSFCSQSGCSTFPSYFRLAGGLSARWPSAFRLIHAVRRSVIGCGRSIGTGLVWRCAGVLINASARTRDPARLRLHWGDLALGRIGGLPPRTGDGKAVLRGSWSDAGSHDCHSHCGGRRQSGIPARSCRLAWPDRSDHARDPLVDRSCDARLSSYLDANQGERRARPKRSSLWPTLFWQSTRVSRR